MKKKLEVGKNYGEIFGLSEEKGKMIYLGDNKWRAEQGNRQMEKECEATTAKVMAYINKSSYKMGSW